MTGKQKQTGEYRLYYYTKVDRFLFENLINGTMMFNTAQSFNDPFDCKGPTTYGEKSTEKAIGDFYDDAKEHSPDSKTIFSSPTKEHFINEWKINKVGFERELHIRALETTRKHFGILCLSAIPDNIKMWSHYASAHRGVCLEFSNYIYKQQQPYIVEYPDDNKYHFLEEDKKFFHSMLRQFFIKATIWKEEQEHRIVIGESGLKKINKESLSKIIFGVSTPKQERDTLQELVKGLDYPNLKFAECQLSENEFKVKVVDL